MKLIIEITPFASGQYITLDIETEERRQVQHLGFDALFDRVQEHVNNKLRPMVNSVSEDARKMRAAAKK